MKEEFSKTSLHNHFGGRSADYKIDIGLIEPRSFDFNYMKTKLDEAQLKKYQILGMTNANCFWVEEYLKAKKYIEDKRYDICLIPGVEFNIINDFDFETDPASERKFLHLVMLVDPQGDLRKFSNDIRIFCSENGENFINVSQLTNLVIEHKCILIPHGKKQSNSQHDTESNIDVIDDLLSIKEFIPLMIEDNTKTQRRILEERIKVKLSKDNFDWFEKSASISSLDRYKNFSDIVQPTYIWGEPTFEALFYSSILGKSRVFRESDIIEKNRYIRKIKIKNNGGVIHDAELNLSHGMNSIIGNSGSGKTLLLNLIKNKLVGNNLVNAISSTTSDYSSMYSDIDVELYDNRNEIVEVGSINVFEGENLYSQIVSTIRFDKNQLLKELDAEPKFSETQIIIRKFNDELSRYITDMIAINKQKDFIQEKLGKIRAAIDYLNVNPLNNSTINFSTNPTIQTKYNQIDNSIKKSIEDKHKALDIIEKLQKMISTYGVTVENDSLNTIKLDLLKKISESINTNRLLNVFNKAKIHVDSKLSEITNNYNAIVGERFKIANQSNQIVSDEVEQILNKLKSNYLMMEKTKVPVLDRESLINSIQKKDDIIKLENFNVTDKIDYDDLSSFFDPVIGSARNKLNKSLFLEFRESGFSIFSKESIVKFSKILIDNEYENSNYFLLLPEKLFEYDILIRDIDDQYKKIDSLSAGQLSKIYINLLIDTKLNAIENNAIILYDQPDNNLEKGFILETLGKKLLDLKRRYQLIITTHEPLLVINSDSNCIIKAENNPIGGKNSIGFENLYMYDVSDKQSAIDRIAVLIDGSHVAIKLRNQVYGGTNYD